MSTFQGSERELTNIDPVFKVYHDCDDGIKVRFDKFVFPANLRDRIFEGIVNVLQINDKIDACY